MKQSKRISTLFLLILLTVFSKNFVYGATGKVITDTLMLRKSASTDSNILDLTSMGDELEIIQKEGDWYKVKYNEKIGYVSAEYVKVNGEQNEKKQDVVEKDAVSQNNAIVEEEEEEKDTEDAIQEDVNTVENNAVSEDATEEETNKEETINVEQKFGKIKEDSMVYITPLINSLEIGRFKAGVEVEIISKTNNWVYIKSEEITGWVVSRKIEQTLVNDEVSGVKKDEDSSVKEENVEIKTSDNSENVYKTTKQAYIKEQVVNIRQTPSKTSEKVMTLTQNTEVTIVGENGDWYKIKLKDKEGYVLKTLISDVKIEVTTRELEEERKENTSSEDVTTAEITNATGSKIVEYAEQFLGCKYVYGASGPTTFDCSGFTQYVYKNCGYTISRSARTQAAEGVKVSKDNLQQGDLVVFYDNNLSAIGHIGIYIGGGRFIHASSYSSLKCLITGKTGSMVKVSDLTSGEYAKRYHSAVRIIK